MLSLIARFFRAYWKLVKTPLTEEERDDLRTW